MGSYGRIEGKQVKKYDGKASISEVFTNKK